MSDSQPHDDDQPTLDLTPAMRAKRNSETAGNTQLRESTPLERGLADPQESQWEPAPPQRAWGFLIFIAATLALILTTAQRMGAELADSPSDATPLVVPADDETTAQPKAAFVRGSVESVAAPTATSSVDKQASISPSSEATTRNLSSTVPQHVSLVTFASNSIVTTERAVAAVFVLKRSHPPDGRALVHWESRSGSADAAIDFSDASGTAVFAEGHEQAAIYVRLRNDLLKEPDETFKVCLRASQLARVGAPTCAEATIQDDD